MTDQDINLKKDAHHLLDGLKFECKAKYDDDARKLKEEGRDLIECDGVYYHPKSQTLIYLEATTQQDKLTKYLCGKHQKITAYYTEVEKKLGLSGFVNNRILLFVSDTKPTGDELDTLDLKKLRIVYLDSTELRKYYLYLFDIIGEHLKYEFDTFLEINEVEKPKLVNAIRIIMAGRTVYVFELTVDEILKTCYVFRKKEVIDEGYQRLLNKQKLKSINEFIGSGRSSSFPNSILINLCNKVKDPEETAVSDIVTLAYPMISGSYKIIDGQHRVYGYCKTNKDLTSAKLVVVAFKDVPEPEDEIRFFLKINKTQTKINPALLTLLMAKVTFSPKEEEFWLSQSAKLALKLSEKGFYKDNVYKGEAIARSKKNKATMSYMADRIEQTKLLVFRKKVKKEYKSFDGLLQKENDLEKLDPVVDIIDGCAMSLLEVPDSDKGAIRTFFITNRGFDLICRIIKGYYKLKEKGKIVSNLNDFFKQIKFTPAVIEDFKGHYGVGGMSTIADIARRHIKRQTGHKIEL